MHSMIFLHLHIDFLPMLVLDGVRVEIRQVVMGRLTAPYSRYGALNCAIYKLRACWNASGQQPARYRKEVCIS
jgi:hypothetical protein